MSPCKQRKPVSWRFSQRSMSKLQPSPVCPCCEIFCLPRSSRWWSTAPSLFSPGWQQPCPTYISSEYCLKEHFPSPWLWSYRPSLHPLVGSFFLVVPSNSWQDTLPLSVISHLPSECVSCPHNAILSHLVITVCCLYALFYILSTWEEVMLCQFSVLHCLTVVF